MTVRYNYTDSKPVIRNSLPKTPSERYDVRVDIARNVTKSVTSSTYGMVKNLNDTITAWVRDEAKRMR